MGAWEPVPAGCSGKKHSVPMGSEFRSFSQPPGVPQSPGSSCSGLRSASQHGAVRELAFAAALCIPAVMPAPKGGQFLHSPGTLPLAKPTALSQLGFSFVVESRRMGHVPGAALPFPPGWQRRMLGPGGDG